MVNKLILASITVYILLFLYFYPPFYTTLDENNYIRSAYLIQEGSLFIEEQTYKYGFISNGENYVPLSFGLPAIILPFTLLSWKAVFLSGLLTHILATILFYKLLIKHNLNPNNTLLYLFFPYFFYYSTTLFPDFFSAFFILAGFYFYNLENKKNNVFSGAFFGFACILKYTNILAFLPFAIVSVIKNRSRVGYLLLGFLPFAFLILTINQNYYGGWMTTGYALVDSDVSFEADYTLDQTIPLSTFSLGAYKEYIPFISFRLLIIYPLMLLALFLYRGSGRTEIILTGILYLAFFGARSTQSGWGFNLDPSTMTRYFLPILPLLIFAYIPFYEKILEKIKIRKQQILYSSSILLVIGGAFILNIQHDRLEIQESISQEIYLNTEDTALLIGESDMIRYVMEPLGNRRFLGSWEDFAPFIDDKTYIVHKRYQEETSSHVEMQFRKMTEDAIKKYDTTLIWENEYFDRSRFFASRPFVLEIYKIENDFILEDSN
tara:strand:+ start:148 stop:1623 length:1476 start_codon:yes stop_codon:yes gene_type:complete